MAHLAPKAKVLRDGRWSEEEAAILVPGDVISIKLRDIVPTDACTLEGDPSKIDQSLTCESLPVTKGPGPRGPLSKVVLLFMEQMKMKLVKQQSQDERTRGGRLSYLGWLEKIREV
ncbi:hypothetical protein Vadar_013870 [Vaccinium darrowii]|uniref:Uncharacterized protein n=1 Tax=Vaccinium darrowii TaxID=229202 RepID=A0ACB7ZJ33_9ERIC|nr:hypothetical protein Vadar_013870 [Vaccinium darrowii]